MITNTLEYELALEEIDRLMDAKLNTEEGLRLVELSDMVNAYEDAHYPVEAQMSVEEYRKLKEEQGYE